MVDLPLVKVGRIGDGLTGCGYQFLRCGPSVELGTELLKNPTVRLGQFDQQIDQFCLLSPRQRLAQGRRRVRSCFGWNCSLGFALVHGRDPSVTVLVSTLTT